MSPSLCSRRGCFRPATLQLTAEIVCADCYPLEPLTLGAVFVPVVAPPQSFFNADAGQPLTGVTFNLPALEDYPGLSNPVFTDADTGDNFVINNNGVVTGTAGPTPPETLRGYWTADGMLGTLTLALASAAVLEFAPAALIVMEGPGARFHNAGLALSHSPPADATFRVSLRFPSQDAVGAGDVTRFRFNGADAMVSGPSFEITLAVGEREAMLEFEVEDDEIFETPEGFSLELELINGDGARAGASAVRAMTLVDPISLAARMTVLENEGKATVTVMLGNDRPTSDVTVGLLYGGAAGNGDYSGAPASVVIAAGETSAEFDFVITDDIVALEHLDPVTFQGGYTDLRMSVDTVGFAGVQRDIYMNLPEARPGALMHIMDDDTLVLNIELSEQAFEGAGEHQACVTYSNPFALSGTPGGMALWMREWNGVVITNTITEIDSQTNQVTNKIETSVSLGYRLDALRLRTNALSADEPTDVLDSYEEAGMTIQYRHTPLKMRSGDTQNCFNLLLPPIDNKSEDQYYGLVLGTLNSATWPPNMALQFGDVTSSFTIYDVPVASFPFAAATVYAPEGHTGAGGILDVQNGYTLGFASPSGGTLFALSPSTVSESSNDHMITLLSPGLQAPTALQLTAEIMCADCPGLSVTLEAVYAPISAPTQTAYAVTAGTALAGVTFSLPSLEDYPGLSNSVFMDADSGDGFAIDGNGLVTGTPSGSGAQIIRGLWTADGMLGTLTLTLTLTRPGNSAANPERENAAQPSADFSAVLCGADNCQNASVSSVSFPSSGHVKQSPKQKIKAPRAAAPAAACVAGRSTGQHMLPQPPSEQTATAPPLNLCRSQAPLGNASREALLRIPAPATALRTNGNSVPIKPMSFPSSEHVKESPKPKPPRAILS